MGHERLRPAERLADPVPRLEARGAFAGLQLPVLANAHPEPPRRLPDRPPARFPILLEHRQEQRYGGA